MVDLQLAINMVTFISIWYIKATEAKNKLSLRLQKCLARAIVEMKRQVWLSSHFAIVYAYNLNKKV